MKTPFLIALILLFSASMFAQISYPISDFAQTGENFTLTHYTGIALNMLPIATAGENTNWNFASLGAATQSNQSWMAPDQTGYRESFIIQCIIGGGNWLNCVALWYSSANLAQPMYNNLSLGTVQLSNVVEFYNKANNQLKKTVMGANVASGGSTIPVTISYLEPDVMYNFPITYNNKDTSISSFNIDLTQLSMDMAYKNKQRRINFVDAWGQLTTPYMHFNNVIRLKTILEHTDTAFYNGTIIPVNTNEIIYTWFASGKGTPVLQVKGYIQGNLSIYNEAIYLDTIRCLSPTAAFMFLPVTPIIDPANQEILVNFINLSQNCDQLTWDFGDPQSGNSNFSSLINPEHLFTHSGLYIVKLKGCNSICSPIRCDSIQIPVAVTDTTAPLAAFTFTPTQPCQADSVYFINLSINANSYLWNFGDGTFSNEISPSHLYISPGIFEAKLMATNEYQTDTMFQTLEVTPETWAFAGNDTIIYGIDTVNLFAYGGTLAQYLWSPPDFLSCTDCTNPIALPEQSIDYILKVTDVCGVAYDTIHIEVNTDAVHPIFSQPYNFQIIPNPFSGIVKIHCTSPDFPVLAEWVNSQGIICFRQNLDKENTSFDLHNLTPGYYFVKITTKSGIILTKSSIKIK